MNRDRIETILSIIVVIIFIYIFIQAFQSEPDAATRAGARQIFRSVIRAF